MTTIKEISDGTLHLCQRQKTLRESHLFPWFLFKWMKATGSGYLRSGDNLNIRIQDGPKAYLLCADCESHFSNFETYFAKNIFYPVLNEDAAEFAYSDKLRDFVISVLWRLVKYDFLPNEAEPEYQSLLTAVEKEWAAYLLGQSTAGQFKRIHLICGVDPYDPDHIDQRPLPDRLIYYFARQIDAGVTGNLEHKFIYLKLPRMIFIIPVQGLPDTSFKNSAIGDSGLYRLNDAACLEPMISGYFYNRVVQLNELHEQISPQQKQKIQTVTRQQWEKVKGKDLGIILDYQSRQ